MLSEYSAESTNSEVELEGTLSFEISNGGVIPSFSYVTVDTFEIGGEMVLEGSGVRGGLVTGTSTVDISFSATSSSSKFTQAVSNGCVSGSLGGNGGSNFDLQYTVNGAGGIVPGVSGEVTPAEGLSIESQSCNIDTGGSGGGSGTLPPTNGEVGVTVDSMSIAGSGVDVVVSTSGVGGGESCTVDVQLVDEEASGTGVLDNKEKSRAGNFNSETWEFRDLGAQAPTTIRADVNMLEPEALYTSETVEFTDGSGGGFLAETSDSTTANIRSMSEAAEEKK